MEIEWFQYFQFCSLLLSIIYSKRLQLWKITFFIPLLLLTNGVEVIGVNFRNFGWDNNYFLYNSYLLLTTPLMLYLFYRMLLMNKAMRQLFQLISFLIILFQLLNFIFIQGVNQFNNYSLLLIAIVNIIMSCVILFQVVFADDTSKNLFSEPYFWINSGTLFFNLGTLVLFGLQRYIIQNHVEINNKSLYHALAPILNMVLYSSWGYGFFLCKKKIL